MIYSSRIILRKMSEHKDQHTQPSDGHLRVISWNLLRRIGASVEDVIALIEQYRPDLFLMQEATKDLAALPATLGGHFVLEPLHGRGYGLVAWSPNPFPPPCALPLPVSTMPGRVPPRVAQILRVGGVNFANVHLSHGQFLNRWQLLHIVRSLNGPSAIIGDYNAVGPIKLAGFKDIGPRGSTVIAGKIISFRVDRCMARGLTCSSARMLERGSSDHHPIILDLAAISKDNNFAEQYSPEGLVTAVAQLRGQVGNRSQVGSPSFYPIRIS
jgi:endonuclease/exonuclease/phosphatase (EEP) superfamily protein YafD